MNVLIDTGYKNIMIILPIHVFPKLKKRRHTHTAPLKSGGELSHTFVCAPGLPLYKPWAQREKMISELDAHKEP